MKEYLYKKEYKYLYLTEFSFRFGNTLIDIFGTVMLYKSGIPIHLILLIYGIRFGIMGLFSPLYIKIASRYGVTFCRFLANACRVISSYMLITNRYNIIMFTITMGLSGALSNPIGNAMAARFIDEKHRGKYNSLRMISNILGTALATAVITIGVVAEDSAYTIALVVLAFTMQLYFAKKMDYKPEDNNKQKYSEIIKDLITLKTPTRKISAIKACDVIEKLFVPLYVYIALKDFVAFSVVIIVSLTVQSIIMFASRILYGQEYEKN